MAKAYALLSTYPPTQCGVLIEAVTAGKPVISTAIPPAVEMLAAAVARSYDGAVA